MGAYMGGAMPGFGGYMGRGMPDMGAYIVDAMPGFGGGMPAMGTYMSGVFGDSMGGGMRAFMSGDTGAFRGGGIPSMEGSMSGASTGGGIFPTPAMLVMMLVEKRRHKKMVPIETSEAMKAPEAMEGQPSLSHDEWLCYGPCVSVELCCLSMFVCQTYVCVCGEPGYAC
jgi:hypothetical protein